MAVWTDDPKKQQAYRREAENSNADAVYLEAHDAAEADSIVTGSTQGQFYYLPAAPLNIRMSILRTALWFDTSNIPDELEVLSASLKVTLKKKTTVYYDSSFDWYLRVKGGADLNSLTAEVLANYATLLTAGTVIESIYADDLPGSLTEYNFVIPPGYINKTGNTVISFSHSKDEASERPDYSPNGMAEWAGIGTVGANEPILTVHYIVAPTVTTNPATSVGRTGAVLNGTLSDDGGEACEVRFQWGLTTAYGNNTEWQSGKEAVATFEQAIIGTPGTTYHFRAQAENSAGTTNGADSTFTTSPWKGNPLVDQLIYQHAERM